MNSKVAVYRICLCLVFLACYYSIARTQQPNLGKDVSTVRIVESLIDLSSAPSMVENNCIAIEQDGKFHMELRLQKLPSPSADLKVYEGMLSNTQRDNLRSLLNDANLKGVPDSEIPRITPVSNFVKMVRVQIQRDNSTQQIGFAEWSRPSKSREGASAEEIEREKRLEVILQPLMDWFHHLQRGNPSEVKTASTLCGGELSR